MSKCDWVEVRMDLRIPPGTPKPTDDQWAEIHKILGAEGFTNPSARPIYRKFNRDA